jgi:hypothetical protein
MAKAKVRLIAADIVGGGNVIDIPFFGGSYENVLNSPGSLDASVPLYDEAVQKIGVPNLTNPARTMLGLLINNRFQQLGPIWKHSYSRNRRTLTLKASGVWSYWNYRALLPRVADTEPLLLPDSAEPNPATNLRFAGMDYGTIAKRAVELVNDRPGQMLPMVYEADRAGLRERNVTGADLKSTGGFLEDLTNVINGPDIMFEGEWDDLEDNVRIRMRTGTEFEPRLFQLGKEHRWDYSVADGAVRGLEVDVDGQDMADTAWTTGGRSADMAMVDRQYNPEFRRLGYPRLDYVDSSHSTVVENETLSSYGLETLRRSGKPTSFWSFEVRSDRTPVIGEYKVGDYCLVIVKGDPYIADGEYRRRIVAIGGDFKGKWIKITTGITEWN